jgi:hypothetical protein
MPDMIICGLEPTEKLGKTGQVGPELSRKFVAENSKQVYAELSIVHMRLGFIFYAEGP